MNLPIKARLKVLRGKVLAKGLYGAAVTPLAKGAVRALRAELVRAVDRGAGPKRAAEVALMGFGACIEPSVAVFADRVLALRRAWHKKDCLRE
eukprot:4154424-Alexandrium_andersonii.AAC.1